MDRVDTKFLLTHEQLADCLEGVVGDYTALSIDGRRQLTYDTLYFDTPDRQMYRDHHNGKLNRMKVRVRHYRDSDQAFLEVKRKTNKGRTVKTRLGLSHSYPEPEQFQLYLRQLLGLPATRMSPALFVQYQRATLLGRHSCERVTVDTGLGFVASDTGKRYALPGLAIVELKTDAYGPESPVAERMKALGIRPLSFSKYCIGTALLAPERVKTNRFKPVLGMLSGAVRSIKESSWNRQSIPISSFV